MNKLKSVSSTNDEEPLTDLDLIGVRCGLWTGPKENDYCGNPATFAAHKMFFFCDEHKHHGKQLLVDYSSLEDIIKKNQSGGFP